MPRKIHFTRSSVLIRLKHKLESESYPRLQMGFIIFITGVFGFLCSYSLLRAGIESMALRYL